VKKEAQPTIWWGFFVLTLENTPLELVRLQKARNTFGILLA